MNMKIKVLLAVLVAIFISGCSDVIIPDKEGWKYAQKEEFLKILKTDKYASLCNQKALYAQVLSTKNSLLMSNLLVAYTKNLANGCINLHTSKDYSVYRQTVSKSNIMIRIKAGQTIEQILAPYVPKYREFDRLLTAYKALENESNASSSTLHKIRLNIERIKLMKPDHGKNYALINIPEFKVRIIENNIEAVSMAVVVGKKKMPTPIFSTDLKYITLNPQWSVPDSIARNEIIPKLIRNPNYLTRKRMVMRSSYDLNSKKLSPSSVNLKKYSGGKGHVPFKFIEVPSKRNGLGRVKFIFPNRHSVYMHDTQSKHLFKRKVRMYSHGCVRLSQPIDMLEHITVNYTARSYAEVKKMYDSLKSRHVSLNKKLAVHTAYLTAYVDDTGKLLLFNDVYGFDSSQRLNF